VGSEGSGSTVSGGVAKAPQRRVDPHTTPGGRIHKAVVTCKVAAAREQQHASSSSAESLPVVA
jgi:hypothetical protein